MTDSELKPCPFCGSEKTFCDQNEHDNKTWIECTCGCRGPWDTRGQEGNMWNSRPTERALCAELEAVKRERREMAELLLNADELVLQLTGSHLTDTTKARALVAGDDN